MKLPFLHQEVEVSTDLRESNDILDSPEALQERIAADGYLLIRGLHDPETCPRCTAADFGETGREGHACTKYPTDGWYFQSGLPRTDLNRVNGEHRIDAAASIQSGSRRGTGDELFQALPRGQRADVRF